MSSSEQQDSEAERIKEKVWSVIPKLKSSINRLSLYEESLRDRMSSSEQQDSEAERIKEKVWSVVPKLKSCINRLSLYEMTAFSTLTISLEQMQVSDLQAQLQETEAKLQEAEAKLQGAEAKLHEGERLRKKLHSTILELKGNIRVFIRVRPFLSDEGPGPETTFHYPTSLEYAGRGIVLVQNGRQHSFTFDKVFTHAATQEDVFEEVSELVQSAIDGYKVCIFAYGQTGTGKTFTMMGRLEKSDQKGLIPRALEQIFQAIEALTAQGWKLGIQASMLEIYNDRIRDLLSSSADASKKHSIRHDAEGNTFVSDLTIQDVGSIAEVFKLLKRAAKNRSVGKTDMNKESSRSHYVSTLRIDGVNEATKQQVRGVLNLVDLAGSQRLEKSKADDIRIMETREINKSLSSLSDVICAILKEEHIPYRNSQLTYLLQPCLGGDSKTLMIVNLSPDPSSVAESLCSLRFAARVNACVTGIPRRVEKSAGKSVREKSAGKSVRQKVQFDCD